MSQKNQLCFCGTGNIISSTTGFIMPYFEANRNQADVNLCYRFYVLASGVFWLFRAGDVPFGNCMMAYGQQTTGKLHYGG